jgi:hypothetical protein
VGIDVSGRSVLLLHDGELADVRSLVEAIGARVLDAREGPAEGAEVDVVLATPRYLREVDRVARAAQVVRIAVLDHDARTLRALCRRAGVDLVVRRPVHPVAVRKLLLHALYRGPDRRARRVAVGVPVRFRTWLRSRPALLADLSVRGCQLVGCKALLPGRRVSVSIADPGAPGRSFSVSGRVVRTVRGGESGFAMEFRGVSERVRARLREAVAVYGEGPAACSSAEVASAWRRFAPPPTPAEPPDAEAPEQRVAAAEDLGGEAGSAADDWREPSEGEQREPFEDERRGAPRRLYEGRRVVALDEEAARVLVGHDLSAGGMRVAPNPALFVGQLLRVALYGSPGETPLVLEARVARDDGERGLVLRFGAASDSAGRYLKKLLDALPVLDGGRSPAPGLVVSEILEAEER